MTDKIIVQMHDYEPKGGVSGADCEGCGIPVAAHYAVQCLGLKGKCAELEAENEKLEQMPAEYCEKMGIDVSGCYDTEDTLRRIQGEWEAMLEERGALESQLAEAIEIFNHLLAMEVCTPDGSNEGWIKRWLAKMNSHGGNR